MARRSGDGAGQGIDLSLIDLQATVLASIRDFFAQRGVREVATPLLYPVPASDPQLAALRVVDAAKAHQGWLQTSPEFAMKRLLAAGSGSIYQLCKAFRGDERGRLHATEFTLLEWYRVGWSYRELRQEVTGLVMSLFGECASPDCGDFLAAGEVAEITYRQAFTQHLHIDPVTVPLEQLRALVGEKLPGASPALVQLDRDSLLQLLLGGWLEPLLARLYPAFFLIDFPVSQAAMARLRGKGDSAVAERFELYLLGVEIANGYSELTNAAEQRRRFAADNAHRAEAGLAPVPVDEALLAAMDTGLPECAGVALGVDRLLMLLAGRRELWRLLD